MRYVKIFGLFLITGILVSCSESKIDGFEKGENDVHYKVHHTTDDTTRARFLNWVTLNMDYRLGDTLLYSSKSLSKPLKFSMIEPMFKGDLYDGLAMMTVGDSMTFAIVADSFFLQTAKFTQLPDFVTPGEPMYYDVKLLKVQTDAEYQEELTELKEQMRQEELIKLDQYLKANNITIPPRPSGLIYLPIEEGSGRRPDTGEMCRVFLEVQVLEGQLLYTNFEGTPIDVEYGKNFDTKGFMEGLGLTRVGGSATLIVPSPIGVGERGKETVDPFTTIMYKIKLDALRTVEEVRAERAERKKAREAKRQRQKDYEVQRLQKYLADNAIAVEPTASGLYFIELEPGNGKSPVKGDKVKVAYKLFNTNGQLISSSEKDRVYPEFIVGDNRVITAWEEAILLMEWGGKAQIVVPSKLAYGSRGQGKMIGAYEPLIYEMELLED